MNIIQFLSFLNYNQVSTILKISLKSLMLILQPEYEGFNTAIDIEFDDIAMKTKLVVRPGVIAIMFDEESFFGAFPGFTPHCVYKNYNEHISQKIVNLSTLEM